MGNKVSNQIQSAVSNTTMSLATNITNKCENVVGSTQTININVGECFSNAENILISGITASNTANVKMGCSQTSINTNDLKTIINENLNALASSTSEAFSFHSTIDTAIQNVVTDVETNVDYNALSESISKNLYEQEININLSDKTTCPPIMRKSITIQNISAILEINAVLESLQENNNIITAANVIDKAISAKSISEQGGLAGIIESSTGAFATYVVAGVIGAIALAYIGQKGQSGGASDDSAKNGSMPVGFNFFDKKNVIPKYINGHMIAYSTRKMLIDYKTTLDENAKTSLSKSENQPGAKLPSETAEQQLNEVNKKRAENALNYFVENNYNDDGDWFHNKFNNKFHIQCNQWHRMLFYSFFLFMNIAFLIILSIFASKEVETIEKNIVADIFEKTKNEPLGENSYLDIEETELNSKLKEEFSENIDKYKNSYSIASMVFQALCILFACSSLVSSFTGTRSGNMIMFFILLNIISIALFSISIFIYVTNSEETN